MIHRTRPLYGACNEDSRSELRALEIGPDDSVVSICAGGGRALSLLTSGPQRLTAIDRRADQLFQLELKAAAIEALDYQGFVAFLGLTPEGHRLDTYAALRGGLSPSARRYWDRRRWLIAEGVMFAGRCERAFSHYIGWLRRLGRLDHIERLFGASDLEAQAAILQAVGDPLLRSEPFWRLYCDSRIVFLVTQDPGFLRSTHGSVGRYLFRRLSEYVSRNLVRDSFMLHLMYFGDYGSPEHWPPYLQREGFEQAKKNLDRLQIVGSEIGEFASRLRTDSIVKWSLSDVACWMSERRYHDLIRVVTARGLPGSRLCVRHFAARHSLPHDLKPRLRSLEALSQELDRSDRSIFWSFDVCEYGAPAR